MYAIFPVVRRSLIRRGLYGLPLVIGLIGWQCRTAEPVPAPTSNSILAVSLPNTAVLQQAYDDTHHTWTLTVAYLTNLRSLAPVLSLAEGVTVVPRSGEAQDFSRPVYYTVTTATGAKTVYTVTVQSAAQLPPRITSASTDTLEAGQTLWLTGHNFGLFGPDVQVLATGPTNLTTQLTTTWLDSTQVKATFPVTMVPGVYRLRMLVRNLPSPTTYSVLVRYPSPQLLSLNRQHLRGGDTLWVQGLYMDSSAYQYALRVTNGQQSRLLASLFTQSNGFAVPIDSTLPAGRYRVQVVNRSEQTTSRDTTLFINLYDRGKPFVTGVVSPQSSYGPGESVYLKTAHFLAIPARFYQLQLAGDWASYVVNGLYDPGRQQLTMTMPDPAIKGAYTLNVRLLDTAGQLLYQFDTDEQFILR